MEREKLYRLLRLGLEKGASDIHFQVDYLPLYRFHGELVELRYKVLTPEDTQAIVELLCEQDPDNQAFDWNEKDLAYELPGEGRFRVNISRPRRNYNIVLRVIPPQINTLAELNLPSALAEIAHVPRGYVLVTGATGMGKSTTLAAILNGINTTRKCKIVTIEDPIEFVFSHQRAIITQREIGTDTGSFPDALHAALRQDPDVIMVGEMRDLETVDTSLKAAETGHLVFSTLHTRDAKGAISRYVDFFPQSVQNEIRSQLSMSLRAVVSQHLLRSSDPNGKQELALEIMFNNVPIASAIRLGKIESIETNIQTGRADGMITLDESIKRLLDNGQITRETAERFVSDRNYLNR